jgi:transposase-like protein
MSPADAGLVPVAREVEVVAKAERRRFTAEYKLRVLREADACSKPGEVGALLRREGLYSSHLSNWRLARERGELAGLSSKKRGPKTKPRGSQGKRSSQAAGVLFTCGQRRRIEPWILCSSCGRSCQVTPLVVTERDPPEVVNTSSC